jgi:hypothetical protein
MNGGLDVGPNNNHVIAEDKWLDAMPPHVLAALQRLQERRLCDDGGFVQLFPYLLVHSWHSTAVPVALLRNGA